MNEYVELLEARKSYQRYNEAFETIQRAYRPGCLGAFLSFMRVEIPKKAWNDLSDLENSLERLENNPAVIREEQRAEENDSDDCLLNEIDDLTAKIQKYKSRCKQSP